jgi:hypothetical protein
VQFDNLAHTKGLKGVAVKSKDLKTLECIDPDTECVRDFLVKGDCNGQVWVEQEPPSPATTHPLLASVRPRTRGHWPTTNNSTRES